MGGSCRWRSGRRSSARTPHGGRTQLHRHLPPQRPVQASVANWAGERRCRRGGSGRRRRHRHQGRRPGRLLRGRARRVRRNPGDAGRPAGQAARRRHRAHCGDADAQGSYHSVPVPPDVSSQVRRDDSVSRRRGRSGSHRLPMGARAGRNDDWHGGLGRESGNRQGPRLHAYHRLHAREFRRTCQGADRRQGRTGRLRRRRQGDVPRFAGLSRPSRTVRRLR